MKKIIRLIFICHGNICRSPMAESVMAYLVKERGLDGEIVVSSAAAHTDEIGNPPHYGTREKLKQEGIPLVPHRARLLTANDGGKYDYFLGMDDANVRDIRRILPSECNGKIFRLLDFTNTPRAIADPWYTGNFDATFNDVLAGCNALLDYLGKENARDLT